MTISKEKQLREYIYAQHRQHFSQFHSPKVVAEAFRTSVENTVNDTAPHLTMPTLVIGAENDQVSSHVTQKAFAESLSHGAYVEISEVGHLIHYEKASEAAGIIRKFLKAI